MYYKYTLQFIQLTFFFADSNTSYYFTLVTMKYCSAANKTEYRYQ